MSKQLTKTQYQTYESRKFTEDEIEQSGLPFKTDSLRHYLNLSSAIIPYRKASTKHDQWITVDYIFYTKFKRKPPANVPPSGPIEYSALQLLSYMELPSVAECAAVGPIPNSYIGSDHYALAVEFVLLFPRK